MTDYNIPMSSGPQGAAAGLDTSAPLNPMGARIPQTVQPFTPIDAGKDIAQGYKNADTAVQFQENQEVHLENQQKRETSQRDTAILKAWQGSGHQLYSAEDLTVALHEMGDKLSPEGSANLAARLDKARANESKLAEATDQWPVEHLKAMKDMSDFTVERMRSIQSAYDEALKKDPSPQGKQAALQAFEAAKAANLQALGKEVNPITGKPALPPEMISEFSKLTPDNLPHALEATKYGQELATSALARKLMGDKAEVAEASAADTRKKTSQRDDELKVKQDRLKSIQGGGVPEADVTPEERKLAVNQWVQNPSSMRGMDKTYQRNVVKWAADLNITPEDVLSGRVAQKFDMSSATTSGHRAGTMAAVEKVIPKLIKNAEEASSKVDRGSFVPWNQLMQMADTSLSDPALKSLKNSNVALGEEYAIVISRGGSNVESIKIAMDMLQSAESPEAYSAGLRAMEKAVKANVEGVEEVRAGLGTGAKDKLSASKDMKEMQAGQSKASTNTADRLLELNDELKVLQASPDNPQKAKTIAGLQREIASVKGGVAQKPEATKVLNGVTYHVVDGKWVQE